MHGRGQINRVAEEAIDDEDDEDDEDRDIDEEGKEAEAEAGEDQWAPHERTAAADEDKKEEKPSPSSSFWRRITGRGPEAAVHPLPAAGEAPQPPTAAGSSSPLGGWRSCVNGGGTRASAASPLPGDAEAALLRGGNRKPSGEVTAGVRAAAVM